MIAKRGYTLLNVSTDVYPLGAPKKRAYESPPLHDDLQGTASPRRLRYTTRLEPGARGASDPLTTELTGNGRKARTYIGSLYLYDLQMLVGACGTRTASTADKTGAGRGSACTPTREGGRRETAPEPLHVDKTSIY